MASYINIPCFLFKVLFFNFQHYLFVNSSFIVYKDKNVKFCILYIIYRIRKGITISAFLATTLTVISQTFAAPDPNFHIYLAFGQSNMEGAGPIGAQDQTVDKRFQMLSTVGGCNGHQLGNWYDAVPPLAHCGGKLGPVDYFGRTMVKKLPEQIKVGVAVVAVAGCDIQLFEKDKYQSYNMPDWMQNTVKNYGGNPYGRLIDMGKKAMESGVIKGILLHQGETNTGQQDWPNRVKGIYDNIIKDLGLNAQDVPLLAGEVVSSGAGGSCGSMNPIIQKLPQVIPTAHVVSSEGLQQQGDGLHFTSEAYRTFGERYAEEMLKILGNVSVAPAGNQAPAGQEPAGQAPANNAPVDNAPAGQAPAGQAPANNPPFGQAPGNNPPFGQAPAGQAPGNNPPFGQAPANNEQPAQNPPAQNPPAQDPPAQNPPAGNPWGGNNQWNQWGGNNGGNNNQWNPWGGNNGGNNNQWNPWGGNNGGNNNQWNPWGGAPQGAVSNAAAGNSGGNCAGLWGQCGGNGFNGATCCSEGTCKPVNEYFHQCQL